MSVASRFGTSIIGIMSLPLMLILTTLACFKLALKGRPWSVIVTDGEPTNLPPEWTFTVWLFDRQRPDD